MIYVARLTYRAEKPYGIGATAHARHMRVEGGWRAEIVDGLDDGRLCYTGVEPSAESAKAALVARAQAQGLTGIMRFVR